MNFDDLIRDWLRDPLAFFVLSYLVGAAMCGAWALAMKPLRRALQDQHAHQKREPRTGVLGI